MADPERASRSRYNKSHLCWSETVCDFDSLVGPGHHIQNLLKRELSCAVVDLRRGPSMAWIKKHFFEANVASFRPHTIGNDDSDKL
jgi:hypothetical protein